MSRTRIVVVMAAVAGLSGCAGAATPSAPAPAGSAIPLAVHMPREDFARLAWLEGTWRGEGVGEPPFWERYRFVNDTTVRIESFTDSALAHPPETGEIRWRDGMVTIGSGGSLWVVTRWDRSTLRFEPVAGARNDFMWRRDSDDAWTAVLSWPAVGATPARERVYHLRRWP